LGGVEKFRYADDLGQRSVLNQGDHFVAPDVEDSEE
jgi:hypothetical protein